MKASENLQRFFMSKVEIVDGVPPSRLPDDHKGGGSEGRSSSYSEILKSSSIIGGAQVINMLIGLVRTKLIAIFIGPEGIGLIAIYQAIIGIASSISGLGIQTSGVRDIAKLHSQGNNLEISNVVHTLRRVCWISGIAGTLLVAVLSSTLSWQSFESYEHTNAFIGLAIIVFLTNITGGQTAIIQGTRRMSELAQLSILSAIGTTIIVAGVYSVAGIAGIVPALVSTAAVALFISTFYANRIPVAGPKPSWKESFARSKSLIYLGSALVASSVFTGLTTWGIQVLVSRQFGIAGLGIYSAAFSLSGLFVQFVLVAMGSDFYPRLVGHSHNNEEMARLINEQTEVGVLLALPGLIGTLALAPWLISIFYTPEFSAASDLLKWFVLGCIGRVVSWPLGYSLLAKGQGVLFALSEAGFNLLHLLLVWVGSNAFGLTGVAVAFAVLYACYTLSMLLVNYVMLDFFWSADVVKLVLFGGVLTAIVFGTSNCFSNGVANTISLGFAIFSSIVCGAQLFRKGGIRGRILKVCKWKRK